MKKSVFPLSLSGLCSIAVLFFFLIQPKTTVSGARNGLLLWFQTVLPTLLPFMVCSNFVVASGAVPFLILPFRRILGRMFGLSDYGCYTLLSGLLCGYPMGAKTCGEFLRHRQISLSEARLLLAISNHPSPMFLLGYAAAFLETEASPWKMICSLYLPVIPLGVLARSFYGADFFRQPAFQAQEAVLSNTASPLSFDRIFISAFEVMIKIGGYIMAFSILAAFIEALPVIPATLKALALGFVEITTGIRAISGTFTGPARGLFLTAAVAFGGLSGLFQTGSVLKSEEKECFDPAHPNSIQPQKAGLSIRHYLLWKCIHTLFAIFFYQLLQIVF